MPAKSAPNFLYAFSTWKENTSRITNCTTAPVTKATATEIRMPDTIVRALELLM